MRDKDKNVLANMGVIAIMVTGVALGFYLIFGGRLPT